MKDHGQNEWILCQWCGFKMNKTWIWSIENNKKRQSGCWAGKFDFNVKCIEFVCVCKAKPSTHELKIIRKLVENVCYCSWKSNSMKI